MSNIDSFTNSVIYFKLHVYKTKYILNQNNWKINYRIGHSKTGKVVLKQEKDVQKQEEGVQKQCYL